MMFQQANMKPALNHGLEPVSSTCYPLNVFPSSRPNLNVMLSLYLSSKCKLSKKRPHSTCSPVG